MAEPLLKRLRRKLSPLENPTFTAMITPYLVEKSLRPFLCKFKKQECVVLRPKDVMEMIHPNGAHNLHDLTQVGRSLQALLWERSYIRGELVFSKTMEEIIEDGF